MGILDLLSVSFSFDPSCCKVHLACRGSNNGEDPLDSFCASPGQFKTWQEYQTRKNFSRPLVLSLIQLPYRSKWLYAGVYRVKSCTRAITRPGWEYETEPTPAAGEFVGRAVVQFARPGRQSYLRAERWIHKMELSEIRPSALAFPEFPGYRSVSLAKRTLDSLVRESPPAWRTPLSKVAGIYLITDSLTGSLYVGSASGTEGIWARWCQYSETGHGGNAMLKEVLLREGSGYSSNFNFSVLEVCDPTATMEEVIERESHWKRVLMTRRFGSNLN